MRRLFATVRVIPSGRPFCGRGAKCYLATHMAARVGVRELRQNLSRYLAEVKDGEQFVVTERGREVARLVPSGDPAMAGYERLARDFGATIPTRRLEDIIAELPARSAPDGTTDAFLAESRQHDR